jgi:hypothetical protein
VGEIENEMLEIWGCGSWRWGMGTWMLCSEMRNRNLNVGVGEMRNMSVNVGIDEMEGEGGYDGGRVW